MTNDTEKNDSSKVVEKIIDIAYYLLGESLKDAIGILGDRIKFYRWERSVRLFDKTQQIIRERGLEGKTIPLLPKYIVPIVENASLEEDDDLQDLWANLLSNYIDPNYSDEKSLTFIEILKQLKPLDAQILNFLYEAYSQSSNKSLSSIGFSDIGIKDNFKIEQNKYELSIDNLIRVRCVTSFRLESESMQIPILRGGKNEYVNTTVDMGYKSVSLTRLGKHFVEACIIKNGDRQGKWGQAEKRTKQKSE